MTDALATLERLINRMSPAQKDALDEFLVPQVEALWTPDRRNMPQVQAYFSKADLMLYGGGAAAAKPTC